MEFSISKQVRFSPGFVFKKEHIINCANSMLYFFKPAIDEPTIITVSCDFQGSGFRGYLSDFEQNFSPLAIIDTYGISVFNDDSSCLIVIKAYIKSDEITIKSVQPSKVQSESVLDAFCKNYDFIGFSRSFSKNSPPIQVEITSSLDERMFIAHQSQDDQTFQRNQNKFSGWVVFLSTLVGAVVTALVTYFLAKGSS